MTCKCGFQGAKGPRGRREPNDFLSLEMRVLAILWFLPASSYDISFEEYSVQLISESKDHRGVQLDKKGWNAPAGKAQKAGSGIGPACIETKSGAAARGWGLSNNILEGFGVSISGRPQILGQVCRIILTSPHATQNVHTLAQPGTRRHISSRSEAPSSSGCPLQRRRDGQHKAVGKLL